MLIVMLSMRLHAIVYVIVIIYEVLVKSLSLYSP
jgi:hypothetical protein